MSDFTEGDGVTVTDIHILPNEDIAISYTSVTAGRCRARYITPLIINLPTRTYDLGSTDDTPTWD